MPHSKRKKPELLDQVASIVLAGGEGTRLFPLTLTRSKPGVSFGGRYRLIDVPISNSLNSKIYRIYVLAQHFAAHLHHHIMETYRFDPFHAGSIEMLCPEETQSQKVWFKGTADAVRQNLEHFRQAPVEYFLILSGDQLYNMNFSEVITFAKKSDADLVILSIPAKEAEARRMGLLKIDDDYNVKKFVEKPTDRNVLKEFRIHPSFLEKHKLDGQGITHYLGSMGIYVFKREALFALLDEKGDDFGKDLIPIQVKKGKVATYVYNSYWEDIGTVASYYHANLALTVRKNCLDIYDETYPIFTRPRNLPSPLLKQTSVESSIISQGSIIEAEAIKGSIIGVRTHIKKGTIIHNSILLGNDTYVPELYQSPPLPPTFEIGENCLIEKAIIDEHTRIGNRVKLVNQKRLQKYDGNGIYIRDGIIIVTSGASIPDDFTL